MFSDEGKKKKKTIFTKYEKEHWPDYFQGRISYLQGPLEIYWDHSADCIEEPLQFNFLPSTLAAYFWLLAVLQG